MGCRGGRGKSGIQGWARKGGILRGVLGKGGIQR